MLIIVPKSISRQVILNNVHYHKFHHHWQIPCQSVAVATRRRQHVLSCAFLKSELRPIFIGARSFSTLRVQAVLGHHFGIFHHAQASSLPPAKLSDDHPPGEAPETWPNKYNWFKWVISPEKTLAWNRTCWCKLQSLFKFSTFFFQKCLKAPTEKYAYHSTTKIFLIFVILILCRI